MPDLAECIRRYHEAQATRDPARPIRVIQVAHLRTCDWRADATAYKREATVTFANGTTITKRSRVAERCAALADTGEHLRLPRVGLIVRRPHG